MNTTSRVVLAARWGALSMGLLLAGTRGDRNAAVGAAALLALTAAETTLVRDGAAHSRLRLVTAAVPALVVATSGGWNSALVPCVLPPVLDFGLALGFGPAAAMSGGTVAAVSHFVPSAASVAWTVELMLLAAVAAHARRLEVGAARLADLEAANRLLTELHAVALSVPLSGDLEEVVRTTADEARGLLGADRVHVELDPGGAGGATSVMLRARGEDVGALVVERDEPLTSAERTVLDGLAAQAGLAIDNARRFAQLRTLAVEEERARIARELHDDLGQDLAGLGYLVDGLANRAPADLWADLAELRNAVGSVVAGLREALTDLRTEVDGDRGLAPTLAAFLNRVEMRSTLQTELHADSGHRLPAVVERELLHIAQEAVVNAERHSRANRVSVTFAVDHSEARLEVRDDGTGLVVPGTHDHYGLVGMRERAEAIGAELEIESNPLVGTTVRCRMVTT